MRLSYFPVIVSFIIDLQGHNLWPSSLSYSFYKIKNILDNLILEYDKSLKILEEYKKSNYFNDKKKCFKITSEKVNQKRGNKQIVFYKYNINIPFKIRFLINKFYCRS